MVVATTPIAPPAAAEGATINVMGDVEEEATAAADGLGADSESMAIKFLGQLGVNASRERPPNGHMCAQAVQYLTRQRSRSRFRNGIAKLLDVRVRKQTG